MIAIGVILTAVIGASTLIITSITTGRISQNRVEAANFAREGVEIVRALRDSNWLKFEQNEADVVTRYPPVWNAGLVDSLGMVNPLTWILRYRYNTTNLWSLQACGAGTCPAENVIIYKATQSGRIWYMQHTSLALCQNGGWTCVATKYSRRITLTNKTDDVGTPSDSTDDTVYVLVESTVTWPDRTGSKSLVARTRLYDWK